jgi:prolyl-tRNA editing enzyme YbaK/EbsC (Cys-tRNA(Pro) deacylase)
VRRPDPQDPRRPERNALLPELHPTALKFRERALAAGLDIEVVQPENSTRTAEEAAAAVGCELGQIVKSVVLVDRDGPLLFLCAGDRRIDLAALGSEVALARGGDVKRITGYAIGGVPPLGHDRPLRTLVDSSLGRFDRLWCAAGTPRALFSVDREALLRALDGARLWPDPG